MALPMIVTNYSIVLMQFADAWMLGSLSADALAAVNPAGLLFFVPISFGFGLLTSVNTFVGQSYGRRRWLDCGHYAWQGIWIAILLGTCFLSLHYFAEDLFALFGHEPAVQALEVIYFQISLWGAIPQLIVVALSRFLVAISKPRPPMWIALLGALLNVFFNYGFIFGHFGLPAYGMAGAALGTVGAITFQAAALLLYFWFFSDHALYGVRRPSFSAAHLMELLRKGWFSGAQFTMEILSWSVTLIWLVGLFGTLHLAASTIIVRLMHLSFMPTTGLAIAMSALVAQAVGRRKWREAKRIVWLCWRLCLVYMGSMGLLFFLFRHPILGWFTDNAEVVEIGGQIMVLMLFFQLFDAIAITYTHALWGRGDYAFPALVNIGLALGFFLTGGYLVATLLPEWGSFGPWLMATLYVGLLGFCCGARWQRGAWQKSEKI